MLNWKCIAERSKKRWSAWLAMLVCCPCTCTVCIEHDSSSPEWCSVRQWAGWFMWTPCYQRPTKCHAASVDELIFSSYSFRERSNSYRRVIVLIARKDIPEGKDMRSQRHKIHTFYHFGSIKRSQTQNYKDLLFLLLVTWLW